MPFPFHLQLPDISNLQFHFDQSKVRSQIRLREGRIKPIDILSNLLNGSDDFDLDISEPYMVFKVTIYFLKLKRLDVKDLGRVTVYLTCSPLLHLFCQL